MGCGRVEVEYVDPSRGRERRPLAACWSSRFERMSPVRGFASFQGQRNWPGWWWFSRTGPHVGYESWVERDVLTALDADPGVEARVRQFRSEHSRMPRKGERNLILDGPA